MNKYKIPVEWAMYATVKIEADSAEQALAKYKEIENDLRLPTDSYYIDDSFRLCYNDEETLAYMKDSEIHIKEEL